MEAKKKSLGNRVTFERLAAACGVQKTYLSRVLNAEAHLSQDQLYLACEYLALPDKERTFLQLLHEYERSAVPKRRREIMESVDRIREQMLKSDSYVRAASLTTTTSKSESYFLDPFMPLVHMFLTIDDYARAPRTILSVLAISEDKLNAILDQLQTCGVIAFDQTGCRVLMETLHLSSDSPVYQAYKTLHRANALQRIQWLPADRSYNFNVLFSADKKASTEIRKRFLVFLDEARTISEKAGKEHVYQMVFDLFDWG